MAGQFFEYADALEVMLGKKKNINPVLILHSNTNDSISLANMLLNEINAYNDTHLTSAIDYSRPSTSQINKGIGMLGSISTQEKQKQNLDAI